MSTSFPLTFLTLILVTALALPLAAQQSPTPTAQADTVALTPEQQATRARYAKDLADLERMKEKFRRQQERKLRGEERGGEVSAWNDEVTPQTAVSAPDRQGLPADTTTVPSTVRSGFYGDRQSAVPADANYRQEEELEAMRARLRQSRGEAEPSPAYPRIVVPGQEAQQSQLTEKSPEATPVAAAAPTPANAVRADIVFIANTAYPNSSGYNGLDVLVNTIRNASSVVEVRVHTGRELDRRAAQLLSEERATTIRNYLQEAGIAPANFRVIGFGNHESAAGERVEVLIAQ